MCDVDMSEKWLVFSQYITLSLLLYFFYIARKNAQFVSSEDDVKVLFSVFFSITIFYQETSLSLNLPILILHNLFSKLKRKSI